MRDFIGKRVTIMGLGLSGGGVGAARFFARAGARVTATDMRSGEELALSVRQLRGLPIRYVLGRHRKRDFTAADLIIKNPGVPDTSPYLAAARKTGVAVDTDVGIFSKLCPAPVIGITGTKGKSTTATLIAACLRKRFRDVVLAGNIRVSVLDALPKIRPSTQVVLELSSWQLEGLAQHRYSPHIAVITNILPEHLNRYPSFTAYARAKGFIARYQKPGDHLFIQRGDALVGRVVGKTRAHVHFWSRRDPTPRGVRLIGEHNRMNLRAAQVVARFLGIPAADIAAAFRRFRGLPGRLEKVGRVNGVTFINDTTATMPEAAIAAIVAMPKPPIVITGGTDKRLDYRALGRVLRLQAKAVVFLPGSATEKLKRAFGTGAPEARSLVEAVRIARRFAQPGDTVLFTPGAASFELFANEFDRGEKFVEAVNKLR